MGSWERVVETWIPCVISRYPRRNILACSFRMSLAMHVPHQNFFPLKILLSSLPFPSQELFLGVHHKLQDVASVLPCISKAASKKLICDSGYDFPTLLFAFAVIYIKFHSIPFISLSHLPCWALKIDNMSNQFILLSCYIPQRRLSHRLL